MINKQLNVGDYIFSANGRLARITKVNKQSYTFEEINAGCRWNTTGNCPFNGIKHGYYDTDEWFYCENADAKALECAKKRNHLFEDFDKKKEEIVSLIGKAKYFLKQIEEIAEIDPIDEDD